MTAKNLETEIYRCEKCDFEFDDEDALETHHELYHENENYICDKCDADFDEEDALETHKELYHDNENYICDKGDADFNEEDAIETQKELYHENEYKCKIWDYETTTQRGVNIHKGAKQK